MAHQAGSGRGAAIVAVALLSGLLAGVPQAGAQAAGPGPSNPNCAIPFDTVNPVGGAVLGQIRFCLSLPLNNQVASSNSAFNIGAQLTTPVYFPLLATVTTTLGFTPTAGCTLLGNAVSTNNVGTGAAIGFEITTVRALTMTASVCYGYVEAKLTTVTPAVTYYDYLLPFVITANDAVRNQVEVQCGSTSTVNAALPYISPCAVPSATVTNSGTQHLVVDAWPAVTGSLIVTNAGGQAITVSGTLDTLSRWCAASATGTTCSTPTVNLAGSVTVHADGTLTVTNAGGQTMTLAGAATIHADGSLTVTNAGGQALTFAGPLTVHQDPICTATEHCHVDGNQNTTLNVGTVNSNTTMSNTFSLDIPLLDRWVPLLFWVGMVFFAYYRVNLAGPRYLMMLLFTTMALFTSMFPSMALLGLYGGITCVVFCLYIITMLNRWGFLQPGKAV